MRNFILLLLVICAGVFLLSSDSVHNAQAWLSKNLYYLAGAIFAGAGCVWVLFYGKSPSPYEFPSKLSEEEEFAGPKEKARLKMLRILSERPDSEGNHKVEQYEYPEGFLGTTTEKNGTTRWWSIFKAKDLE